MKSWITAFIFIIISCCRTYSQNKNTIGLDFQLEYQTKTNVDWNYATTKTYQASAMAVYGIVYERLLSKNTGIEVEIKYQTSPNEYSFLVPGGVNSTDQVKVSGKESFLSMPILFRYRTKILNISLGPTLDYFLNWKQTSSNYYIPYGENSLPEYFFPDTWSLGLLFKISESIPIGDQCIVEPGIFYSPILSYKNNSFGLSVLVKHPF